MNNNNIDLIVIKLFFNFEVYSKFSDSFQESFLKTNNKDLYKVYSSLKAFHEQFPSKGIRNASELKLFFHSQYPASTKADLAIADAVFEQLDSIDVDPDLAAHCLNSHRKRVKAVEHAQVALDVSQGQKPWEALLEASKAVLEASDEAEDEASSDLVAVGLSSLVGDTLTPGLRWRLKTMNKMMGSLRKGNFGFLFARPEAGKTTFVADQVSFMVQQTKGNILWFNNEQVGEEVRLRLYQAMFGVTRDQLFKDAEFYEKEYVRNGGDRIILVDRAVIDRGFVDRLCNRFQPVLIVFDQLDKIKGFSDDRNDLELKAIYQWARELAKDYGPVIGVCQAGASGEGKRWLDMDDVDGSKTAKQGEADWILGIGKQGGEGFSQLRHLHLCKNKLPGDEDTIPELRHGKSDVLFFEQVARYKDL